MSEQQFRPGDRVKVTMNLTIGSDHELTAAAYADHADLSTYAGVMSSCEAGITVRVEYHPGAEKKAAERLTAAYRDVMRQLGAEADKESSEQPTDAYEPGDLSQIGVETMPQDCAGCARRQGRADRP